MCQSTVYLVRDGQEEEILRDVVLVEPEPGGVRIQALLEAPRLVKARIKRIDLLKHKVLLEPVEE